jgi:6-phosphogluconolactonase
VTEPAERLVVAADAADGARRAAALIASALRAAAGARGRADWATTGGSAAPAIYRSLVEAPLRDEVPWADVHVWWGDDRFVPRDHPLSNVKPLDDILLDPEHGIRIPLDQLHPFRVTESLGAGGDAPSTADALAIELQAAGLPLRDGWPVLDLIVVGIGGDGHLLSVFPDSAAFDATAWALAIPAPTHIEPHVERVTMHPAVLEAAEAVLAVVFGAGKADILAEIFGPVRDPRRWPAQLARRLGATWIVDEAAAARLGR